MCWAAWGWLSPKTLRGRFYHWRHSPKVVFAASLGVMGHAFVRYPQALRYTYLSTLQSFWDTASVQHKSVVIRSHSGKDLQTMDFGRVRSNANLHHAERDE
jgi:hypothetical protein